MRLIDADTLYELIDGGYDLDFDEVPETKKELLRMINEQETVGRWIPVTEKLPNDEDDVLITFCGEEETRIVPVNYYQKIWFDCIFDIELNPNGVLAWMPLPEPWKGDDRL